MVSLGGTDDPRSDPISDRSLLSVLEKNAHGLAVVDAADGLGEDGRDVDDVELGADTPVLVLGHGVGDEHLVNGRGVDSGDGVATEDAVADEGVDHGGALALEELGGAGNGVGSVDDVVDEDADAVGDVADEHHAGVPLLVEFYGTAFLWHHT